MSCSHHNQTPVADRRKRGTKRTLSAMHGDDLTPIAANQNHPAATTSAAASGVDKDAYTHYPIPNHDNTKEGEVMSAVSFTSEVAKVMLGYLDGDVAFSAVVANGETPATTAVSSPITASHIPQTLFGKSLAEVLLPPMAKRAATLILGGEAQEVEEAIALAEAHPAILGITVTARDRSGSPDFCLMTTRTDFDLAMGNKHLYIGRAADNGLDYKVLDLQGKPVSGHITPQALGQEIKEAPTLYTLNTLRGPILDITSKRGHTPLGRAVKGTLLQIAAMAGDVDLKEGMEKLLEQAKDEEQKAVTPDAKAAAQTKKENLKKQRGIVERLAAIKGGLTREQVAAQLEEVITSEHATKENSERVERIMAAITTFGESILRAAKEYKEDVNDYNNFKTFQTLCQPVIDALEKALQHNPNKVTTSGYLFDPVILQKAAEWFEKNLDRLGGWWTILSYVFWVNGWGKLQQHLSARDGHVVRHGIGNVVDSHQVPSRTCNNSDGSSYINSSSGLGRDFYLGYYGSVAPSCWLPVPPAFGAARGGGKLMSIKNSSVAKLMQCSKRSLPSRCLIM